MENLKKVLDSKSVQPTAQILQKYTNVMKGFQPRYCRIDAEKGILLYYLLETDDNVSSSPRGIIPLLNALINPSDEDSRTFTINTASGEVVKFKANDARSRQEWVDGLRAVVESAALQERSNLPPRENLAAYDCMKTCRKQLQETEICNAKLVSLIEFNKGPSINCNDPDLLSLKALTTATVSALNAAYSNLQKCQYHEIKLINSE